MIYQASNVYWAMEPFIGIKRGFHQLECQMLTTNGTWNFNTF